MNVICPYCGYKDLDYKEKGKFGSYYKCNNIKCLKNISKKYIDKFMEIKN